MARVNSTTKETGNNFNVANGTGAAVRAGINDIFFSFKNNKLCKWRSFWRWKCSSIPTSY